MQNISLYSYMALGHNLVALLFTSKELGFMGVQTPLTLIIIGFHTHPEAAITRGESRASDLDISSVVLLMLVSHHPRRHPAIGDAHAGTIRTVALI